MLSEYQRAVLSELGVECWQCQDLSKPDQTADTKVHISTTRNDSVDKSSDKNVSQTSALEKLSQLKNGPSKVSYAGKIVCLFDVNNTLPQVVLDILTAMNLESLPRVQVDREQAELAHDFALLWSADSHAVELHDNKLSTPPFLQLTESKQKKQLWQKVSHSIQIRN